MSEQIPARPEVNLHFELRSELELGSSRKLHLVDAHEAECYSA